MTSLELNYTSDELKAVRDAALAGGLAELAAECDAALKLTLPLARVPSLQAVVEAWRVTGKDSK